MPDISKALRLDGYMTPKELLWLAKQAEKSKVFIEIGSWHGRSSRAIADNLPEGAVLYCVDHWKGSEGEDAHESAKLDDGNNAFIQFAFNMFDHINSGKVIPIRMNSEEAVIHLMKLKVAADTVFIDAGHTKPEVAKDIELWDQVLKDGGMLCGHDYHPDWPGVIEAVNENVLNPKCDGDGCYIWYHQLGDVEPNLYVEDRITVGIPTCNRYDALSHALLSIAMQTKKPYEVIVVDDSDSPVDLRTLPRYRYIFALLQSYGINWSVLHGMKKGQHHSHQIIQDNAKGNLIYRMDDDCVAEPNVLNKLHEWFVTLGASLGAIAPLVLMPGAYETNFELRNQIDKINTEPNAQWFLRNDVFDVDHLNSSYMYRKGLVNYDLALSRKAHREETIHSHLIKRLGYSVMVNGFARIWHFREETGGIRRDNNIEDYKHDEKIFEGYMNQWGYSNSEEGYWVVLDNGIGDHFAFSNILDDLIERKKKVNVACCYPDVFEGYNVNIKSIAQARERFGNIEMFNVYGFMEHGKWNKTMVEAFKEMYA